MEKYNIKFSLEDNRALLESKINSFNHGFINTNNEYYCISAKDKNNVLLAGLAAELYGNVFYINYLWVSDKLRGGGLGRELLRLAEKKARGTDSNTIAVDTFSFQAPDFYVCNGFSIIGILECGEDYKRYYLSKSLK